MKANETENKVENTAANELSENDLENVSGGLWGITLIDRCKGCFDPIICFDAIGEKCPRLVIEKEGSFEEKGESHHRYVVSCNKGCFHYLNYTYDISSRSR